MSSYGIDAQSAESKSKEASVLAEAHKHGLIKDRSIVDALFMSPAALVMNSIDSERARHEAIVRSAKSIAAARGDELMLSNVNSIVDTVTGGLIQPSSTDIKKCVDYIEKVTDEQKRLETDKVQSTKWRDLANVSRSGNNDPSHSR